MEGENSDIWSFEIKGKKIRIVSASVQRTWQCLRLATHRHHLGKYRRKSHFQKVFLFCFNMENFSHLQATHATPSNENKYVAPRWYFSCSEFIKTKQVSVKAIKRKKRAAFCIVIRSTHCHFTSQNNFGTVSVTVELMIRLYELFRFYGTEKYTLILIFRQ